jgi:hypothetical protein
MHQQKLSCDDRHTHRSVCFFLKKSHQHLIHKIQSQILHRSIFFEHAHRKKSCPAFAHICRIFSSHLCDAMHTAGKFNFSAIKAKPAKQDDKKPEVEQPPALRQTTASTSAGHGSGDRPASSRSNAANHSAEHTSAANGQASRVHTPPAAVEVHAPSSVPAAVNGSPEKSTIQHEYMQVN